MDDLSQNPSIHPELDNMDPNGHPGMAQMGPPPPHHPPSRKRKKMNADGQEAAPAQPRRLRRSHEACARCRSKKIKVSGQRAVGFSRRCRPRASVRFKLAAMAFLMSLLLSLLSLLTEELTMRFFSVSVIRNIHVVLLVLRQVCHVTKKTVIDKR